MITASRDDKDIEVYCYDIFPGVVVRKMIIRHDGFVEERERSDKLEINYCVNGRFETQFSNSDRLLMTPGDFSISQFNGKNGTRSYSQFPMRYYEGICIMVDCGIATEWMKKHVGEFTVDFFRLREAVLSKHWYWAGKINEKGKTLLEEIYEEVDCEDNIYMRLKLIELFFKLQKWTSVEFETLYIGKEKLSLMKKVRDYLIENRDDYSSVDTIAKRFGISSSQLQKQFHEVYGMSLYQYLKEYRLEQAAMELAEGRRQIMDIALDAGFSNASKFSEGFKKRYGVTPKKYRMKKIS